MAKTPNPPAPPAERTPAPATAMDGGSAENAGAAFLPEVQRVTYTTIEGITTIIPAPSDQADALPTEEKE